MAVQYIFEIQSYSAWIDLVSDDGNPATILQLFTTPDSSGNAHLIYVSFIDPSNGPPSFFGNANGTAPSDYFIIISAALANEGIATSIIALLARPGPKTAAIITDNAIPSSGDFNVAILDFYIGTQGVSVQLERPQLEKLPKRIRKLVGSAVSR